jgi:AcrR family transcriptional regulator
VKPSTPPGARARNRRGRGGQLRDDLIAAGLGLLGEHGDEADVTLRGVARIAGVAPPSVYAHFNGPADLVSAVVTAAYQRFALAMSTALSGQPDPAARLRAAVEAYVRYAIDQPGLYRVVFTRTQPSTLPAIGQAAGQLFTTLETMITAASTDTPPPTEARARAVRLWINVHGYATLRPSHPNFQWPPHHHVISQFITDATRNSQDQPPAGTA